MQQINLQLSYAHPVQRELDFHFQEWKEQRAQSPTLNEADDCKCKERLTLEDILEFTEPEEEEEEPEFTSLNCVLKERIKELK